MCVLFICIMAIIKKINTIEHTSTPLVWLSGVDVCCFDIWPHCTRPSHRESEQTPKTHTNKWIQSRNQWSNHNFRDYCTVPMRMHSVEMAAGMDRFHGTWTHPFVFHPDESMYCSQWCPTVWFYGARQFLLSWICWNELSSLKLVLIHLNCVTNTLV